MSLAEGMPSLFKTLRDTGARKDLPVRWAALRGHPAPWACVPPPWRLGVFHMSAPPRPEGGGGPFPSRWPGRPAVPLGCCCLLLFGAVC